MGKEANKFVYWAPRILAILFMLFLAMFSLDIFDGNYGFWGTIVGLFMHNIPVMILLVVLVISWKHELVGAIVFILFGALYVARTLIVGLINSSQQFQWYMLSYSLIIAVPAFIIGVLFLVGWLKNKK